MSTAAQVLRAALERSPTVQGRCRVVTVDGPAGAGKTTLAEALVAEWAAAGDGSGAATDFAPTTEVIHMDDLYDGWRGVLTVADQVRELLRSLRDHGQADHRRYDWARGAYAEARRLLLPDLLVLEGVGSSVAACEELVSLGVWVEAPRELRLARGLDRDGVHLREPWLQFLADEGEVHRRERARERADLVVDGVTGMVSPGARDRREPR